MMILVIISIGVDYMAIIFMSHQNIYYIRYSSKDGFLFRMTIILKNKYCNNVIIIFPNS